MRGCGWGERTHRRAVGIAVSGNAAFLKGDWKLVRNLPPRGDGLWQLYDLARDPSETADLAKARPERAAELQLDYDAYGREMGVLPRPDGYDIHRQVVIHSVKRQVSRGAVPLALTGIGLVALVTMIVRRRRRPRHAPQSVFLSAGRGGGLVREDHQKYP